MAYTPINWQTGDTITAEKMNKMDNGWGIQESQLFSESVTTVNNEGTAWGGFAYSLQITADSISVTFDGIEYSVDKFVDSEGNSVYGELNGDTPTFNTYPFFIASTQNDGNMIATQSAGTYTVAVSADAIAVSNNFSEAVNQCVDTSVIPMRCEDGVTTLTEVTTALLSGQLIYFSDGFGNYFINTMDDRSYEVYFYPPSESFTVGFNEDELFTINWN